MGKLILDYTNPRFKRANSTEYRLSLKVGINGISFMISDVLNHILAFRLYTIHKNEKITDAIKSFFIIDDRLVRNYREVKIGVESNTFTLIPNRLYRNKNKQIYLETTTPLSEHLFYDANDISFLDAKLIFACEKELIKLLQNYLPTAKIFHNTSSLLMGWHKYAEIKEGKKIYIHVEGNQVSISFFNEKELIFVNQYQFKTSGDFLYYVLMIYDRFELKPEQIPVIISGELLEQSEIYGKLYRYIRNVEFMPKNSIYKLDKPFKDIPDYQNFDLHNLKLCES